MGMLSQLAGQAGLGRGGGRYGHLLQGLRNMGDQGAQQIALSEVTQVSHIAVCK